VNAYFFGGDSEGSPGDSVAIVIEAETDREIKGYSIVFVFDDEVFEYAGSTLEGTRGHGAAIFTPGSTDTTASAGVIYSFSCPPSIPVGIGPLLIVTLAIKPDAPTGTTLLDLRDVAPSLNRLSPCTGQTIEPTLTDGEFEVEGFSSVFHEGRANATTLLSPVPNPSCGAVGIRFVLRAPGSANLAVYDPAGRVVRRLVRNRLPVGLHGTIWDGLSDSGIPQPSGVYYIRLATGEATLSRRMIRLD
jgi:hypothetical protein